MADAAILVFYLRPARVKARATAEAEALALLSEFGAQRATSGPLAELRGVFWVSVPAAEVERATERLPHLGYSHAVDLTERVPRGVSSGRDRVMWRKQAYQFVRLYEEAPELARERAPDRREFELETTTGEVRAVRGYRGSGRALTRRGLPAYDARMLVSLAAGSGGGILLDPFAGVGGLVIAAVERGCRVVSCDVDPVLRFGLRSLGAAHVVADAQRLPFGEGTFDAVATEPPYGPEAAEAVVESVREVARVLRQGGRLAVLCAAWQADALCGAAAASGLMMRHQEAIDRKGVECAVLAWERA